MGGAPTMRPLTDAVVAPMRPTSRVPKRLSAEAMKPPIRPAAAPTAPTQSIDGRMVASRDIGDSVYGRQTREQGSGRDDLLLDDRGDGELDGPARHAERLGEQHHDGARAPADHVTRVGVEPVFVPGDERDDHCPSCIGPRLAHLSARSGISTAGTAADLNLWRCDSWLSKTSRTSPTSWSAACAATGTPWTWRPVSPRRR